MMIWMRWSDERLLVCLLIFIAVYAGGRKQSCTRSLSAVPYCRKKDQNLEWTDYGYEMYIYNFYWSIALYIMDSFLYRVHILYLDFALFCICDGWKMRTN